MPPFLITFASSCQTSLSNYLFHTSKHALLLHSIILIDHITKFLLSDSIYHVDFFRYSVKWSSLPGMATLESLSETEQRATFPSPPTPLLLPKARLLRDLEAEYYRTNRSSRIWQSIIPPDGKPPCYNPPNFSFYSLPQTTSGPIAPPAPTTQIPQNISQPIIPPSTPPRARTPMLPTTFSQAIPAIPITWPTHTRHHSSMEYFVEPTPVIRDPTLENDGDSPMRDRSPSPPHMPYQPRPSGSNIYELEANEQPSPPWKAWLSQPSPPTSITQPISPNSKTSASKRQRHDDGSYTPITSSATSPISPRSPSAQATPDYQSLPSPQSVETDQDPNTESPPMLLE